MTKSMLAGLAAVSAGLCFGDVTSANTVGYITDNIVKAKFNTIGFSFTSVDGKGFQLKDLTGVGIHGALMTDDADQIRIWNPATSGYEMWYYYVDDSHEWDGWYDLDTQMNLFEDVHPKGLAAGVPVWYLSNAAVGGTFDVTFKTPLR